MNIKRGEIYYVCLDPVFGREIGGFKMRPVIVMSINSIHSKTRLVTVIPGTSAKNEDKTFPNIVKIEPDEDNCLRNPTNFQCHQIRAIEMGRFTQQSTGKVTRDILEKIEESIKVTLGIGIY